MIVKYNWLAHRLERSLKRRAALQSCDFSDRVHDVVADAMMEAVLTYERERSPFPAWVARITCFRWQDVLRKEYRYRAQLNAWRLLGWLGSSATMEDSDEEERAATVEPAARAATAYLLGMLGEHSYTSGLDQEEKLAWRQLMQRVEGLLRELGEALGPSYEEVVRAVDMRPGKLVWGDVALQLGMDKRTVRKRRAIALAWLSARLN